MVLTTENLTWKIKKEPQAYVTYDSVCNLIRMVFVFYNVTLPKIQKSRDYFNLLSLYLIL